MVAKSSGFNKIATAKRCNGSNSVLQITQKRQRREMIVIAYYKKYTNAECVK